MKKIIFSAIALAAVSLAGAQTVRNLVVTDTEGKTTQIPADEIVGIVFEDAPEYTQLTEQLVGTYEESGPLGMYHIEFGTGAPDANGDPLEVGDCQVALLLAGPWTDNVTAPVLPAGYYKIGNSTSEWTFDVNRSAVWQRLQAGEDGVTAFMIIDGSVDVRVDADKNYDIRMEFTDMTGMTHNFRYKGAVNFQRGWGDLGTFTEDVNLDFTIGQGRFYSNWYYPFASDLMVQFYEGTFVDGYLQSGYILEMDFYEPKVEDEMAANQRVADGTYTVDTREGVAYEYLPFKFDAGKQVDVMGQQYITKSRLEYYGEDGSRKLGLITGGSFTVSGNGSKFEFDLTTAEGVSVKGTYNKAPYIQNFCDNDTKGPKRPYSVVTSDVTLNFLPETVCIFYSEGHRIIDTANLYTIWFTHPEMNQGDYVSLDLFCDGDEIADGTYTVSRNLAAGGIIPGEVDYAGQMKYSWYGDLGRVDDEGYNTWMGPIGGGTVTISTEAGGKRKFVFDLTDDRGNKITGEYTGVMIDADEIAATSAKIRKNAARNIRRAPEARKR